jgi:hypothetical protein
VTWRGLIVVRILLLVARLMAEDVRVHDEIKHLANHITTTAPAPS